MAHFARDIVHESGYVDGIPNALEVSVNPLTLYFIIGTFWKFICTLDVLAQFAGMTAPL